ncbi:MAG: alkylphosphonate utilization protein [Gammaproteobacteria bacterium]|nr:alkylphosphonate utilization protein [Gammaproteobacteria bacterium]
MTTLPPCPLCNCPHTYTDAQQYVCPECAHEWTAAVGEVADTATLVIRDAYGTPLADGDSVTMIKDLKVKGVAAVLKVGTRVKGIRLVAGDHNLSCRIDGVGTLQLKSEFVRKA